MMGWRERTVRPEQPSGRMKLEQPELILSYLPHSSVIANCVYCVIDLPCDVGHCTGYYGIILPVPELLCTNTF